MITTLFVESEEPLTAGAFSQICLTLTITDRHLPVFLF